MDYSTPITVGPGGLFEIQGPAVDLKAVVQKIDSNLRAHQLLFADAPIMPSFEVGDRATGSLADLHYHLRGAEEVRDQVGAEKLLAPSWAAQLPVIGKWWGRIRNELHNLTLFYVNQAAGRQASFNDHTAGVLRHVAEQADEIERHKRQISLLEDRLASLEDRD